MFKKDIYIKVIVPIVVIGILICVSIFGIITDSNKSIVIPEQKINSLSESNEQEKNQDARQLLENDNLIEDNLSAQLLTKLMKEDTERETQRLEAMEKAPVLKWRTSLIENMRNENLRQTIENLANFDDDMLASSSITEIHSALKESLLVTRLMRVRRLYSYGKDDPDSLIAELRRIYNDSMVKWPEAYEEFLEDLENDRANYSAPNEFKKICYYCLTATYLLAEFGDYDFLPLLSKQYKMHHIWPPPDSPSPVSPTMTFYAMHRLASSYPRNLLSKEASQALDEYLRFAEEFVPEAKQITVTVWDAAYSESDPRLFILNIKKEALEGQKSIVMPLYQAKFKTGELMEDGNVIQSGQLNELFEKLDSFVQIVYPAEENPVP